MTRQRTVAGALVAGLVIVAPGAGRLEAQQAPAFRAVVDAVTIDAFAHVDGTPLAGLTAADFVVRDNGVEQRIDAVGTTDSAHVIIGLDVSGSVDGATLQRLRDGVRTVRAQLTSRDRLSLFTFADTLRVLARAAPPAALDERLLDRMEAGGSTTLHDAVVLGSTLARTTDRPAVLLLFTDGLETASWTTTARVREVLRRTDVVVYPVGAGLPTTRATPANTPYFEQPTWSAPTPGDAVRFLQVLADASGGEFLQVRRDASLADTFAGILAKYRQRYVLSFTPSATGAAGWHRLDVKLRNKAGVVVARDGYVGR